LKNLNSKIILLIFIVALIIRVIVGVYSYKNEVWHSFGDDNGRVAFAKSIIDNGFVVETDDFYRSESIFAPVIPIALALKIVIFGDNWLPIFILNAILGAMSCLLIYYISLRFFNREVSLIAFTWAAFYPNFIRYIGTAGNEPLIVFLFALSVFFAIKSIKIKKISYNLFLYSFFFTLLFHTDERYISFSVLFTLLLFLGDCNLKFKLRKILVFIVLIIILSTPWLIRNYLYYDDFVLITTRTTSLTSKFINHKESTKVFDHEPNNAYFSPALIDSVQMGLLTYYPKTKDKTPIRPAQVEAMKAGNIPHTFNNIEKIFSRINYLWMPFKFTDNYRITGFTFVNKWSLKHNLLTGLSYGLLLPFMLLALIDLIKKKRWMAVTLFTSIMLYHTFIHVAFIPYTRDRYRHPIDFVVIILGIYGIFFVYQYINNQIQTKNRLI